MSSGIFTFSRHQPDDYNGYDYFYVRLYCACLGFQANIIEDYVLLSALQHIFAGFEEDSRSEVVFWIDEWSIEFGFTDDYQKYGKREHVFVSLHLCSV